MSLEIAEEMENIWLIQNASWNKVLDKKKILGLFPPAHHSRPWSNFWYLDDPGHLADIWDFN